MENASKALLIAGGVLIAVILISVLVRVYGNIGAFQRQQLSAEEAQQIEEFNKDYTKYAGQYVYGTEVITVINKAANAHEQDETDMNICITFVQDTAGNGYAYKYNQVDYDKNGKKKTKEIKIKVNGTLTIDTSNENKYTGLNNGKTFIDEVNNKEALNDLKGRAFKCTGVEYDSSGKVNKISFVEKAYS